MVLLGEQEVGALGFGLMGLTWRMKQTEDVVAFPLLKEAIALGCTFWNSAEFLWDARADVESPVAQQVFQEISGRPLKDLSLGERLSQETMSADASPSGVRKSVEHCCSVLGSYIDLFQPARVDTNVPIEDTMGEFMRLVEEGKIRSVGLSECGPQTIRRAAKAGKVAAVEQEYSLWATEVEQNGIIDACRDNGIALVAYSPLGRGMLTGQIRSRGDMPKDDMRLQYPRFSEENFGKNLELVDRLDDLAKSKDCTASQLGIAWCIAQSSRLGVQVLPIPGCTSIERLKENVGGRDVKLSKDELSKIDDILSSINISGGRYPDFLASQLFAESAPKGV